MNQDKPSDLHVIPENDLHTHLTSVHCECEPTRDVEQPSVVIHHSYDGRELNELIQELQNGE